MHASAGVQPMSRKQQLLKRHRRNKRIALLMGLLVLVVAGVLVAWWLPLILAVLLWVAHEAWFADHLFYSPKDDYQYRFAPGGQSVGVRLDAGRLVPQAPLELAGDETLIVEVQLKSSWLGRFLDPAVELSGDRQAFERGVAGKRYLNLTGSATALAGGELHLRGRYCRVIGQPVLLVFRQPDLARPWKGAKMKAMGFFWPQISL